MQLNQLEKQLRSIGYIGDTRAAKLVYLTLVSALLDEPVSTLIQGASGAGKSFALKAAKRFVPETAYREFSGMSEKALAYMGDQLNLKNKTLIIQEAAGFNKGDGRALLRQLLTEGKIEYATVNSTAEKGLKAEVLKGLEGPCGLIMTTTANALHHEDQNRMLSITVEHSPDEIKAALYASVSGDRKGLTPEQLQPWHEAYEVAKDHLTGGGNVVVPYSSAVVDKLHVTHPKLMRDFPKVVSLIQTLALLQVDERGVDDNGDVHATLGDYAEVREIVEDCLAYGLNVAIPDNVRSVVEAVKELKAGTAMPNGPELPFQPGVRHGQITQAVVADHLGVDRGSVSRNVKQAVKDDYLVDHAPGQGKSADLDLGPLTMPEGKVLPTVDELDWTEEPEIDPMEGLAESLTTRF